MKLHQSIFVIVLSLASLCAPALQAQDGLRGLFVRVTRTSQAGREFPAQIAAADFDHDQVPDGAILLETGLLNGQRSFRIEVHLTQAADSAITFSSRESSLAISALDVNQDGAPDIVIEKAFTRQRLQVFLNDGHGVFRKASAEDYPSPDPFAIKWRSESCLYPQASFLLMPRTHEMTSLERTSILARTALVKLHFWPAANLAQSAARAPSSSRAPPCAL